MNDAEIEVLFLTPQEEYFIGTISEIVQELYRRSATYGTCEYKLVSKVAILLDLEE